MTTVVLLAERPKGIHTSHARRAGRGRDLLGGNRREYAPEITLVGYHVGTKHVGQARLGPKYLP